MHDLYSTCKRLVPKSVRGLLKPLYLRWSLRSFTKAQAVTVKRYGFQIQLDPQNAAIDEYVYMHRNWDTHIARAIEEHLHEGGVFVDVGANIGYFTLLGTHLVGPSGKVIAFEPMARLVKQIETSVALNGFENCDVRQLALGDEAGEMELGIMTGNVGGSSLVKDIDSGVTETVRVTRLDDELSEDLHVDMVKVDVEGFELETFRGAEQLLRRDTPAIVFEFSPRTYHRRDPGMARAILELLKDIGYTITDLENKVVVEDIDEYLELCTRQTNLLAIV